jgi:ubiquinone biosynthesis protein Coq4
MLFSNIGNIATNIAKEPKVRVFLFMREITMFANRYPTKGGRAKKFLPNLDHLIKRRLKHFTEGTENGVLPIADINDLRNLPEGTFGRAWAEHIDRNQLTPFPQGSRYQQLHDGIHILTGYGTDVVGKAEVQAFLLGTQFKATHVLMLSKLFFLARKEVELKKRLSKAYQRGCQSHFNADVWQPERLWQVSLENVRRIYRV